MKASYEGPKVRDQRILVLLRYIVLVIFLVIGYKNECRSEGYHVFASTAF